MRNSTGPSAMISPTSLRMAPCSSPPAPARPIPPFLPLPALASAPAFASAPALPSAAVFASAPTLPAAPAFGFASMNVKRNADDHIVCAPSPASTLPVATSVRGCASPAAFGESATSTRSAANCPPEAPSDRAFTPPEATIRRGTSFLPTGSASMESCAVCNSISALRTSTAPTNSAPRKVPSVLPVPGANISAMLVPQVTLSGFLPAPPMTMFPGPSLAPRPVDRSSVKCFAFKAKSGVTTAAGSSRVPSSSTRSTLDSTVTRCAVITASLRESSIRAGFPFTTIRTASG